MLLQVGKIHLYTYRVYHLAQSPTVSHSLDARSDVTMIEGERPQSDLATWKGISMRSPER